MSALPLISVIVPVFNGERYIAAAIESIVAQTYEPVEIIVVDDGSTDKTGDIVSALSGSVGTSTVRYERQQNSGAAAARNRGIELASGDLLAFLDADDVWLPDKLSEQARMLNEDRQQDAVFGLMEQFISPDVDDGLKATLRCPAGSMPGYTHCAMLIHRDAFMRIGFFETGWQIGEFVAWYLKAMENGLRCGMLPKVVLRRRLHAGNQGVNKRDFHSDYVRIAKASLDRRRLASPQQ
jgi:glycosyltransferase involved in cell wall biosynthesis